MVILGAHSGTMLNNYYIGCRLRFATTLTDEPMKIHFIRHIGFMMILFGVILSSGCTKEFDKYYEVPEDLIGTVLDVLEEDGNYTQFIKAVELVEFDDVLGKTGNFTVFAPDDNAFIEFFSEFGYTSLEDIPVEELEGIVYYHIVFWAYSKYMLLYGLGIQDATIEYSTLNFKKQTRFTPPVTVEYDSLGRDYNVYHETKFIPVYSDELFSELEENSSENYQALYPGSTFGGFHIDRAEVIEYDIPAQNGWIHKIDKVLIPPDNHNELLEENEDYSMFLELLERNTVFQYSNTYTSSQHNEGDVNEDGELDSLFVKMNSVFPSGSSPDVENVGNNGKQNILTLFAPTNQALQNFMQNNTKDYGTINQIGEYWMDWYLRHYIGSNYWPTSFSTLTEDWDWDLTSLLVDCNVMESDIHHIQMASNGPFCGLNKYFLPKVFESVAQPIFGDSKYESFCNMLVFYMADRLLNEENLVFTLFAPSNDAIEEAGYMFIKGIGGWGLYDRTDPISPLPRQVATDLIYTHIVFDALEESDFEEGTFIETTQNTYIGVDSIGIYAGGDKNPAKLISKIPVSGKGNLYTIDRMLVSPSNTIFDILTDPQFTQYKKFYQLCYQSGLITLDNELRPVSLDNISTGTNYTCFVPTNEKLEQGIANGIIPADEDSLQQFLRYHFVEGVIFPDGKKTGEINTTRIDEESGYLFNTIEIINLKYDLRLKDKSGNIRKVTSSNHMAVDGVIYQIDSYLLFEQ